MQNASNVGVSWNRQLRNPEIENDGLPDGRNGLRSTGARTPEGKRISSQNASKLGIFSRELLRGPNTAERGRRLSIKNKRRSDVTY